MFDIIFFGNIPL